jgi:hypothetical protein
MPPLCSRRCLTAFPIFVQDLPADSNHLTCAKATGDKVNHLNWSVGMELDHSPHRQSRRVEPSLWTNEPVDDAFSLLDNALRGDGSAPCGDDHTDEVHLLLEENARLRELLAQLSELIRSNVGPAR